MLRLIIAVFIVVWQSFCFLESRCVFALVPSLQAPQVLKRALKGAGQTAQDGIARRIANPVLGGFIATLLALQNPVGPVVQGTPDCDD